MFGILDLKAKLQSTTEFAERNAQRANELDVELQSARNELITLRRQLDEFQTKERNSTFTFDFKTINAFSVERNIHDGRPCTIIGYLLPKETVKDGEITNTDVVREWYLYCSAEQHEQLVNQFNRTRK